MRLSDWRSRSPHRDAMGPKVLAAVDPVLAALGAEPDPRCWVVWGDDPAVRYLVLVPTPAGLIELHVRVIGAGEGPRVAGKLVRWSRVSVGDLSVEGTAAHRLVLFQAQNQVLNAPDELGDDIAAFALELFAAMDGRPAPEPRPAPRPKRASAPKAAKAATTRGR